MLLVDMHPNPKKALVDGAQAITLAELPYFLEDIAIAREAYEKRRALAAKVRGVRPKDVSKAA
jgi:3-deoxy-7-phosphoheptulonate synthase